MSTPSHEHICFLCKLSLCVKASMDLTLCNSQWSPCMLESRSILLLSLCQVPCTRVRALPVVESFTPKPLSVKFIARVLCDYNEKSHQVCNVQRRRSRIFIVWLFFGTCFNSLYPSFRRKNDFVLSHPVKVLYHMRSKGPYQLEYKLIYNIYSFSLKV